MPATAITATDNPILRITPTCLPRPELKASDAANAMATNQPALQSMNGECCDMVNAPTVNAQ